MVLLARERGWRPIHVRILERVELHPLRARAGVPNHASVSSDDASHDESMAHAARSPSPLRFALGGKTILLEAPREDGLDFLEWLGLGRGDFGAIEARTLRPLCQRRLWPEKRNLAPFVATRQGYARMRETASLRAMATQIVRALGDAPEGLVHFG